MKKIISVLFIMLIITMMTSCNPKVEDQEGQVTPSSPAPSEETEKGEENIEIEFLKIKIDAQENIYFSNRSNDIDYNPFDDSLYISQFGETAADLLYQDFFNKDFYPFDPPEIEKFSKINLSSGETSLINNSWVENIYYSEDYIYFIDPFDNDTLKRVKDGTVEVLYPLNELDENYAKDIFIENGILYMMTKASGIKAFDLVSKEVFENRCFNIENNFGFQIQNGYIISLSEKGLVWKAGDQEPKGDYDVFNVINDYYIAKHDEELSFDINNFAYFDNYLVIQAESAESKFKEDLLSIDLRSRTIEVIADDLEHSLKGFAVNDNIVYYIIKDSLRTYNPETKENDMIISLNEGSESDEYFVADDYSGYENIRNVVFINGRCYLYLENMISYSFSRLAELDLSTKKILYLTDFYEPKDNIITTFYRIPPMSFEYPNDYSVFIDAGSAGGTIINNSGKKLRIQISGMGIYSINIEEAYKAKTTQGLSLYYAYNVTISDDRLLPFGAVIYDGEEIRATINIYHGSDVDLEEYEEELLAILKSMHFYEEPIAE